MFLYVTIKRKQVSTIVKMRFDKGIYMSKKLIASYKRLPKLAISKPHMPATTVAKREPCTGTHYCLFV